MASANWTNTPDSTEEDEEKARLKAELRRITEEKKAAFETAKDADERLRIMTKKGEILKRLQEIRKEEIKRNPIDKDAAQLEAELKATNQAIDRLCEAMEAQATEINQLNQQLAAMSKDNDEQKALAAIREHKVEELQQTYSEQNESLKNVMATLEHVTNFSRKLQKETRKKEEDIAKQLKQVRRLEDEISAAEQISAASQLRQLEESPSEAITELKETLTEQQHQQQQQPAAEEHGQGDFFIHLFIYTFV